MKSETPIHNLDSLEKEIYRLQLEAKTKEKQLEENASYIRHNARRLFIDELFCRKRAGRETDARSHATGSGNSKWTIFMEKLTDQFVERAAEGVENLFERLFRKRKK